MKKVIKVLIISLLLQSCGGITFSLGENSKGLVLLEDLIEKKPTEYSNQLSSLSADFIDTPGIRQIKLRRDQREYLTSIYNLIIENNGVLFKNLELVPKFFVIRSKYPFTFSLPNGHIYLSSGIIKRYIKHELVLIALLTAHMIRIHHGLYEKHEMFPVGHVSISKMLALMKLPVSIKHEIGKLAYFSMKRAGLDSMGYLMWIQVQNRNTLEFRLQLGDIGDISVEEFLFKKFIVKQGFKSESSRFATNSSPDFYKLVKFFKKRI